MPDGCLVGIDIGSTRTKALVVDLEGRELSDGYAETPWTPTSSGAEAAPEDLYEAALAATRSALDTAPEGPVIGVGMTGMAEALALLDKSGRSVAPAIAWYDERGEQEEAELSRQFGAERFTALTGLPVSATASIMKIRWIRRHLPDAPAAWRALSIPDYVAYRLGGVPSAELSLASRTGLFDVSKVCWADELLQWADLPEGLFPTALAAGSLLGRVADPPAGLQRLRGAAIAVGGHDHLCAAAGVGIVSTREVLNSCGTAEAYVRSTTPLGPTDLVAAVATGVGVGCHVVPRCQAILAGRPYGLVLGPVCDLLGWNDSLETRASEAAVGVAATGAQIGGTSGAGASRQLDIGLSFSFDETTGRSCFSGIGPGVNAGQAKALAIGEVLRRSFDLYAAVEKLGGPVERVAMSGGWARAEPLMAAKVKRFPGAHLVSLREPGARGAALFAGCAAELFSGPEAFPATSTDPRVAG